MGLWVSFLFQNSCSGRAELSQLINNETKNRRLHCPCFALSADWDKKGKSAGSCDTWIQPWGWSWGSNRRREPSIHPWSGLSRVSFLDPAGSSTQKWEMEMHLLSIPPPPYMRSPFPPYTFTHISMSTDAGPIPVSPSLFKVTALLPEQSSFQTSSHNSVSTEGSGWTKVKIWFHY